MIGTFISLFQTPQFTFNELSLPWYVKVPYHSALFGPRMKTDYLLQPAAEFIIHIWLGRSYIINVRRFEIDCLMTHDFSHETARIVKGFCFRLNGPWHSIATAGWITCAYFQSTYVPMLGAGKLPECVETNNGLKQCKMVNASWILAIIYW